MNFSMYLFIFVAKVLENALATLRLITVANGKKNIGAFLNFIISVIWIFSTGLVVLNIKDIYGIIAFSLGSLIGSYTGSIIETKLAIGSNMLISIIKPEYSQTIKDKLKDNQCYLLKGENEDILLIMTKRKKRKEVLKIIYDIDNTAVIISESAHQLMNKFP